MIIGANMQHVELSVIQTFLNRMRPDNAVHVDFLATRHNTQDFVSMFAMCLFYPRESRLVVCIIRPNQLSRVTVVCRRNVCLFWLVTTAGIPLPHVRAHFVPLQWNMHENFINSTPEPCILDYRPNVFVFLAAWPQGWFWDPWFVLHPILIHFWMIDNSGRML